MSQRLTKKRKQHKDIYKTEDETKENRVKTQKFDNVPSASSVNMKQLSEEQESVKKCPNRFSPLKEYSSLDVRKTNHSSITDVSKIASTITDKTLSSRNRIELRNKRKVDKSTNDGSDQIVTRASKKKSSTAVLAQVDAQPMSSYNVDIKMPTDQVSQLECASNDPEIGAANTEEIRLSRNRIEMRNKRKADKSTNDGSHQIATRASKRKGSTAVPAQAGAQTMSSYNVDIKTSTDQVQHLESAPNDPEIDAANTEEIGPSSNPIQKRKKQKVNKSTNDGSDQIVTRASKANGSSAVRIQADNAQQMFSYSADIESSIKQLESVSNVSKIVPANTEETIPSRNRSEIRNKQGEYNSTNGGFDRISTRATKKNSKAVQMQLCTQPMFSCSVMIKRLTDVQVPQLESTSNYLEIVPANTEKIISSRNPIQKTKKQKVDKSTNGGFGRIVTNASKKNGSTAVKTQAGTQAMSSHSVEIQRLTDQVSESAPNILEIAQSNPEKASSKRIDVPPNPKKNTQQGKSTSSDSDRIATRTLQENASKAGKNQLQSTSKSFVMPDGEEMLIQPENSGECTENSFTVHRKALAAKNKLKRPNKSMKLKEKIKDEAPANDYILNEIVLAKIPGYPIWPARIINIIGETIHIQFLGTGHINPVRKDTLKRFELNDVIPLINKRGYRKAMLELEMILGIPYNLSLFK